MGKANSNILVIDDRPMTPERLEALHQKWLLREDDAEPWDEEIVSPNYGTNCMAG
ncbi:MAG: hypothetical protein IJ849_07600 [Selenomonadaceae bacterium]|nr:hypothetical protein [Selenomonadaceae bacterium]